MSNSRTCLFHRQKPERSNKKVRCFSKMRSLLCLLSFFCESVSPSQGEPTLLLLIIDGGIGRALHSLLSFPLAVGLSHPWAEHCYPSPMPTQDISAAAE